VSCDTVQTPGDVVEFPDVIVPVDVKGVAAFTDMVTDAGDQMNAGPPTTVQLTP
jgi:hypothetical protein